MVRMSDLFKKIQKQEEPAVALPKEKPSVKERAVPILEKPKETEGLQFAKAISRQQPEDTEQMQVAKAMKEKQLDAEKSKALYQEATDLIKSILQQAQALQPIDLKNIHQITDSIVNQIMLGDMELLNFANNTDSEENYLYAHSVNVLILSIEIGIGLGYNKSRLNELSIGALLHDIGMAKIIDLAKQPKRFTEKEYEQVKEHPFYGVELLEKIKGITDIAICLIKEHHEKLDGTGYPQGLKDGQIKEYSRLVGLVNVYEALTHARAYRKKYPPHEAIKEILSMDAKLYEPEMIKALINRIGIYPVGSWVELNTGEIAKVLELDRNFPLRPLVGIIFDSHKKRLEDTRTINLTKQYNIYIKKPIADEEIKAVMEGQQEEI